MKGVVPPFLWDKGERGEARVVVSARLISSGAEEGCELTPGAFGVPSSEISVCFLLKHRMA